MVVFLRFFEWLCLVVSIALYVIGISRFNKVKKEIKKNSSSDKLVEQVIDIKSSGINIVIAAVIISLMSLTIGFFIKLI